MSSRPESRVSAADSESSACLTSALCGSASALGGCELGVERGQFGGTFGDARFERFVDLAQGVFVALVVADVGVARHESAARHRVAANLDDHAVGQLALVHVVIAAAHVIEPARDRFVRGFSAAEQPALGVVAHHLFDRPAHRDQFGRVLEQIEIALVPGHQAQVGVDHRNALREMFERRAHELAVELDDMRGLVEQAHHVFDLHVASAQRRSEHQARGRATDRAREQVLDVARLRGLDARIELQHAARSRAVLGDVAACTLGAEEAFEQGLQIADGGVRARRHDRQIGLLVLVFEKARGTQAVTQAGRGCKRNDDEDQQVKCEADERSMRDQIEPVEPEHRHRAQPADAERPFAEQGDAQR